MPRGGRRAGAGRKPKPKPPAVVLQHPSSSSAPPTTNYPPAQVEEFNAPDSLTKDERDVWLKQAPHAFKAGTLTKASAMAFERYCRYIVEEAAEAKSSAKDGPFIRWLRKEINTLELQFMLTPAGKPMPQAQPEKKPEAPTGLARFRG